ncbi:MAG: DEAD/DEAH box helicase family protein [Syntrophobacteraceae bacterium]|jgi:type III restriction enzyme
MPVNKSMLELKVFQSECAKLMARRYAFFANHPDRPRKGRKSRPFFQALSALTGAGKTPILAQAVALMRMHFTSEPIVLWMSKAKSVVAQTYTNFSSAGKYHEILDGFRVINIQDLTPTLITDATTPLVVMTTTGLFNNKDQSAGALNIYKRDQDLFGEQSPWERLIERADNGKRRPLLIVYDEGHNLSDQQTELLTELEADAYLLASATLKLPANFQKSVIQPIRLWVEESADQEAFADLQAVNENGDAEAERFITTAVSSEKVVDAELVKKAIQFDGTTATMERCIDDLMKRLTILNNEIVARSLGFKPKAIYVCKTNITDDGEKDDGRKPFTHRKAPPIRIWRYLVEEKGVLPKDIAIYADLRFVEGNKPDVVNLFSKGENDFDEFQARDFQHIIFNLSLQEGWDDPACYLAYIDKSMGSSIQVEQVIGRVLRQYGAEHYENPLLNSAHFFLRVDNQSVFTDSIGNVKAKLLSEGAPIEITDHFSSGGGATVDDLKPKDNVAITLHHVYVESAAAKKRIAEIEDDFPIFAEGDMNTIGEAHTASQVVDLVEPSKDGEAVEWKVDGHTNPVRLRWLATTAIRARSSRALAAVSLQNPKFDVRVQVQSKADKQAEAFGRDVVAAFYQWSDLSYESADPFKFGTLRVPKKAPAFKNGLYERYNGFNKFELAFAKALDAVGLVWHRNPSSGGFYIPLLSEGNTANFYPDFIVWKKSTIYCLDTKGGHLLSDAVARKLFDIKEGSKTRVQVRFISEGNQSELRGKVLKGGYTVWKMKSGTPTPIHVVDLKSAVTECLR